MTYIVAGVVIQDGKVLLIQEAKASCRGTWYLPAGRMERDESIVVSSICMRGSLVYIICFPHSFTGCSCRYLKSGSYRHMLAMEQQSINSLSMYHLIPSLV